METRAGRGRGNDRQPLALALKEVRILNGAQIDLFGRQGYLLVENLLDPETVLDPIVAEYAARLDGLARDLHRQGKLSSLHDDLDFRARMTAIYRETGETYPQFFNLSIPMTGVTEETPFWTGPAVFALIRNPTLLDVVESVLGPEIASNPIQHIRIKPPAKHIPDAMQASGLVGKTPWHQDAAVLPPAAETELVTVWVPINDAPVETGCLQFVEGGHKAGLSRHGFGKVDGLELPADAVREDSIATVPAKRGDVLLIHRHCPHASLPNVSDQMRFSLDLRFHPAHQASGREIFPSFVARSRSDPSQELIDAAEWTGMWLAARQWLATSADAPQESYAWLR